MVSWPGDVSKESRNGSIFSRKVTSTPVNRGRLAVQALLNLITIDSLKILPYTLVSSDWMEQDHFFQSPKMSHRWGFQGIGKKKASC